MSVSVSTRHGVTYKGDSITLTHSLGLGISAETMTLDFDETTEAIKQMQSALDYLTERTGEEQ